MIPFEISYQLGLPCVVKIVKIWIDDDGIVFIRYIAEVGLPLWN